MQASIYGHFQEGEIPEQFEKTVISSKLLDLGVQMWPIVLIAAAGGRKGRSDKFRITSAIRELSFTKKRPSETLVSDGLAKGF